MPEILQEYSKRYQEVNLTLKLGTCCDIIHWLKEGSIDVAYLIDKEIVIPGLESQSLIYEPIVMVASPNCELASKNILELKDLTEQFVVLTEKNGCYREAFETFLEREGIQLNSVLELGSIEAIKK